MKRLLLTLSATICMLFAYSQSDTLRFCRIAEYVSSGQFDNVTNELSQLQQEDNLHILECAHMNMDNALMYMKHAAMTEVNEGHILLFAIFVSAQFALTEPEQMAMYFHRADSLGIRAEYLSVFAIYSIQGLIKRGDAESQNNNPQRALEYYDIGLSLMRSYLSGQEYNPLLATVLNLKGLLLYQMEQYSEAEQYLSDAVAIWKPASNEEYINYASSLITLGLIYQDKNDWQKAEQYTLQAMEIRKVVLGDKNGDYGRALFNLGVINYSTQNYSKAETYYLQAQDILKSCWGDTLLTYGSLLNNIGLVYKATANFSLAESYFLQALDVYRATVGEQSESYASALNHLGNVYLHTADYAKAESCFMQSAEISKTVSGQQSTEYGDPVNNLSVLYLKTGDLRSAEIYLTEALAVYKSVTGENSEEYAMPLYNFGELYEQKAMFTEAERYSRMALEIRKNVLGEHDPSYAASLAQIGHICTETARYDEAETYLFKSANIYKSVFGNKHPDYGRALSMLGKYFCMTGHYDKAKMYFEHSLAIIESALGKNNPDYANALVNLGLIYSNTGEYQKAESIYLQALEIKKAIWGEHHSEYATSLNNLGTLYWGGGDYRKAESCYLQASEIWKTTLGERHPHYILTLHNLGIICSDLGDYQNAEKYLEQALTKRKEVYGEQHPDYAQSLLALGTLYQQQHEYAKAEPYYLQAVRVYESTVGSNHSEYAMALSNLGTVYEKLGDFPKAADYHDRACETLKKVVGDKHPSYALELNNIGTFYTDCRNYPEAEKYYLQALEIYKTVLDETHPSYAISLINLGIVYHRMHESAKAESYYRKVFDIHKKRFARSLDFMSERQRALYWNTVSPYFEKRNTRFAYECYPDKHDIATFAYDNELFLKGVLLQSSEAVKRSVAESGDTALIRQWNELQQLKQTILAMQEKHAQPADIKRYEQRAESLEKAVTLSSATYREHQRQWHITWDSVRTHLRSDEVAIEYMIAPLTEDSTMYCALLLRHGSEYPEMIPLFEEKQVASLINTASGSRITKTYSYADQGKNISRLVWSKILPRIKQGETIYFAPSGLLHQLAVEALPYDESHTMADQYNLVRVSSTREIAMSKAPIPHTTATLYGGIQYNVNADTLRAESRQYADRLVRTRSLTTDTIYRGRADYLPGTKTEVEAINAMLGKEKMTAQVFTAARANEESFKALSGTHQNILHIATHGFFWTDTDAKRTDYFAQRMLRVGNDIPTPSAIDPLSRCGLLFAGANTALQGRSSELPEGVQDGILTAKEISLLDLRDADLVVLSACETGMGEVTGDGVFGLQRAFKQAGVQTIVMSLWPVNDAATQLLMTEFYNNWITLHQPKREAFHNAQNTVRNYTTTTVQQASNTSAHQNAINKIIKNKQSDNTATSDEQQTIVTQPFKEPVYWAGFVMLD